MTIKKIFKKKYLLRVVLPIVGVMLAVMLPLPTRNGALFPIVFAPSHVAESSSGHASGENFLFIQTETSVTAELSEREVEYVEPVVSQGGVSIKGVSFDGGLTVEHLHWTEPYDDWTNEAMLSYLESHGLYELEQQITSDMQALIVGEGYFAIHYYSKEPLKYTTRFSVNPIEGEWWD